MRLYLNGLALAVTASFVLGFIIVSAIVPDRPRAGVEISQTDYGGGDGLSTRSTAGCAVKALEQ